MQLVKNPPANAGDVRECRLTPWVGETPWRGNGSPLRYSCLENPTDRGSCCWAAVHRGANRRTRLSDGEQCLKSPNTRPLEKRQAATEDNPPTSALLWCHCGRYTASETALEGTVQFSSRWCWVLLSWTCISACVRSWLRPRSKEH